MTSQVRSLISTLSISLLLLSNLTNGCYKNHDYSPMSWSNGEGTFYYYFDETNMNVNYYYAMAYAMDEFNRRTDVRWFYRPNIAPYKTQYELITVYSDPANSNSVSTWFSNKKLRIYDNWGHVYYKAVHEAAHGVGFLHEHQRSDKPSIIYDCSNGGDDQKKPYPFSSNNCYFRQRIIEHSTNRCIVPVSGNYGVGNQLTLGNCPPDHYIWYEDTTDTIRVDKDNCLAVNSNDYNSPRNGGQITIEPCDLNNNRFKFKLPHQQEMLSYNGQAIDLSNSRDVLQTWTVGSTNERFQVDYEDNYWKYDRWSVLHYGNEIGAGIHAAYGECSGRNFEDTCGDDDCKKVVGGIQLSNSDISRINWIYRNEISSQTIGQSSSNNMPGGDYSYLMPKDSGCPTGFEDSAFYFDDEDNNNDNTQSSSFWSKFVGGNSRGGVRVGDRDPNDVATRSGTLLYFCASMNSGSISRTFEDIPGQYCYMIRDGQSCPSGFAYSDFVSDDEDDDNDNKAFGKVHVVTKWGTGSVAKYCCKNNGNKDRAVHVVPSTSNIPDAFSLFPLLNAGGCQKVQFYEDSQHWVERDSEDDTNSNNWRGDWYTRPDSSGEHTWHFRMQVCHYEKNNKRITNRVYMSGNGLCLDVKTGNFGNGQIIQMFACHDNVNQRFYYNEISSEIRTYDGRYCLDVHGPDYNSNINGAKVQIWVCNGNNHQKWDIIGTQIKSNNGKCLDIDGSSKFAQLWGCHGGWNQQFKWSNPHYE